MKYLNKSSLNSMTGVLERVVAEGCAGQRPWVALDCIKMLGCDVIASDSQLRYGASPCDTNRVIRVRCTDLGLKSYLALLVENWSKFCSELAEMRYPSGRPYNLNFESCPYALWDGECEETGEFYVEFDASGVPEEKYGETVEGFLRELSPVLIRMAMVGPNAFNIEIKKLKEC